MKKRTKKKILIYVFSLLFIGVGILTPFVYANDEDGGSGFSVGPMNQKLILDPGESYTASFKISNPGSSKKDIRYELSVQPFYVNDEYATIFEDVNGTGQMADWITLDVPDTGVLAPNENTEILFTIDVPKDAPGGGQYASIVVKSLSDPEDNKESTMISEVFQIGHLVFAEITGTTVHQGEIVDIDVPSFLLSGDISGSSSIKNTGNVHGTATYKLQIFPLFSDEEVYTNEEDPETRTILPDRVFYNNMSWDKTPGIGVYNVVYTVEFEGVTAQVSKMVIICPIWLLFVIIFAIFLLIFYFVAKAKKRRKNLEKKY